MCVNEHSESSVNKAIELSLTCSIDKIWFVYAIRKTITPLDNISFLFKI